MLSKIITATVVGIEGVMVSVEVDVARNGFPSFKIVGLPDKSIEESKERIRSAIVNSNYSMPQTRTTVNLAPADIPKEGSQFDLPIVVGILSAKGWISGKYLKKSIFIGELSLDGSVCPIAGVLPIVAQAKEKGIKKIFMPIGNLEEGGLIKGIEIIGVKSLTELIAYLNSKKEIVANRPRIPRQLLNSDLYPVDFGDIKGQGFAKRALEIAVAGGHNVLLIGSPGTGKTMLARAVPSIMPEMDEEELVEVTKIYSVSQAYIRKEISTKRPFRAPHHTISRPGLIGGGSSLSPGEITLAHRGVLFLDELPEFPSSVIEAMRQPLEDGVVTISRSSGTVIYPTRFILIATANPCPCGYIGHQKKKCVCLTQQVLNYKKKLSGPIMDRIDIYVNVLGVTRSQIESLQLSEKSAELKKRVMSARNVQKKRFSKIATTDAVKTNGEIPTDSISKICILSPEARALLGNAYKKLSLSARAYMKIIKVGQTIADLSSSKIIQQEHIMEALQYRRID